MNRRRAVRVPILIVASCLAGGFAMGADPFTPADELVKLGRYQEALPLAREALAKYPNMPQGHFVLAKVQFYLSQFAASKQSLEKCLALGGDQFKGTINVFLACMAFWHGEVEKAEAFFANATPTAPLDTAVPAFFAAKGMQRKQTDHYLVHVEDALAEKGGVDAAAATMESIHEVWAKVFHLKGEKIVSPVYLFATWESYRKFANEALKHEPDRMSDGTFMPDLRAFLVHCDTRNSTPIEGGLTESARQNMYTMGFSQFCLMFCPGLPPWFERGCADYAAEAEFDKGKPKLGTFRKTGTTSKRKTRYERMKIALKDNAFVPLSVLLAMDHSQFFDQKQDRDLTNHAHAWSFVHFLLHSKKFSHGRKLLASYFVEMREGRTRQEAYAKTFGAVDISKIEKLWRDHVEGL